jgi:hypothetical protein
MPPNTADKESAEQQAQVTALKEHTPESERLAGGTILVSNVCSIGDPIGGGKVDSLQQCKVAARARQVLSKLTEGLSC